MVQLTYDEMSCIKGGISVDVILVNFLPVPASPPLISPVSWFASSGDKRTPRPGSGGVSA